MLLWWILLCLPWCLCVLVVKEAFVKSYQVTLVNRENRAVTVAENETILEAVEDAGITLPYGCRFGACVTCAARLLEGEVDQSEGVALKPAQEAMGYVLLCV